MEESKESTTPGTGRYSDLSYLNTIAKGNKEFLMKFLNTFITQMSKDLPLLKQQLEDQNWEGLSATAHKMKPSFVFVGIKECQDIVVTIENDARDQINLDELPGLVSKLTYICEEALIELKQDVANF